MIKNTTTDFIKNQVLSLKKICKEHPVHEPIFDYDDVQSMSDCIKSSYVSTVGNNIEKLEKSISKFTGSNYVCAVLNGTIALHLSLLALNAKKDSEIIVPSLTYVSTANAVIHAGCKPVFADIEENNFSICPKKLKFFLKKNTIKYKNYLINKKTKNKIFGIILVHLFGRVGQIEEIMKICKTYNLKLIEDAAEALGSFYKGRHAGTFADIGIISLNGNKIITSGGGGLILTSKSKLYKKCVFLSNNCKTYKKNKRQYGGLGYNYKLTNLNASLAISQLKKINYFLKNKKNIHQNYLKIFKNSNLFYLLKDNKNQNSNYWLQTLVFKSRKLKNIFFKECNKINIKILNCWEPLHKQKHLKKYFNLGMKNTTDIQNRILHLPSNFKLKK